MKEETKVTYQWANHSRIIRNQPNTKLQAYVQVGGGMEQRECSLYKTPAPCGCLHTEWPRSECGSRRAEETGHEGQ